MTEYEYRVTIRQEPRFTGESGVTCAMTRQIIVRDAFFDVFMEHYSNQPTCQIVSIEKRSISKWSTVTGDGSNAQ